MPCSATNRTAIEQPSNAPAIGWIRRHGIAWSLDYETFIPSLDLPDPDDRHVLAAAIVGRCDVIVTCNLRDFPEDAVAPYGLEVLHPDNFLTNHLDLMPGPFCDGVRKIRERLVAPPISVQDYLAILAGLGLVATAAELARFSERL